MGRKDLENKIAKDFFIENGYSQKKISLMTGVSERTVGEWARKGKWKIKRAAKKARQTELLKRLENLLLDTVKDLEDTTDREERRKMLLEITKIKKTIELVSKKDKPSLITYINIIERFTADLLSYDVGLYKKLLKYQEIHIRKISENY